MWTEMKGIVGTEEQWWSRVEESKLVAKGSLNETQLKLSRSARQLGQRRILRYQS